ncbi:unnamed protein product [Lota lota]
MALLIYTRTVLISQPQIKAFNEASDEVLTGQGPTPGPWGPGSWPGICLCTVIPLDEEEEERWRVFDMDREEDAQVAKVATSAPN